MKIAVTRWWIWLWIVAVGLAAINRHSLSLACVTAAMVATVIVGKKVEQ